MSIQFAELVKSNEPTNDTRYCEVTIKNLTR